jgi:hypothetical protein
VRRSHDHFESLSGAIALGEATPSEREEFALHAAGCALCYGEATDPGVLAAIGAQRDTETWRPSVDRQVLGRIHASQSRRTHFTLRALAWAAAGSIAINGFFVTGFAAKLGAAILNANAPPADIASTQFVRLPAQTFVRIKHRVLGPSLITGAPMIVPKRAPGAPALAAAQAFSRARAQREPPFADPPDFFAGIEGAHRDSAVARSVAVELRLPQDRSH